MSRERSSSASSREPSAIICTRSLTDYIDAAVFFIYYDFLCVCAFLFFFLFTIYYIPFGCVSLLVDLTSDLPPSLIHNISSGFW